jgi:hypothetical protein
VAPHVPQPSSASTNAITMPMPTTAIAYVPNVRQHHDYDIIMAVSFNEGVANVVITAAPCSFPTPIMLHIQTWGHKICLRTHCLDKLLDGMLSVGSTIISRIC